MANESNYGSISALVGNIYEIALQTAREMNIMAPLVTTWGDVNDSRPRVWATYTGGTYAAVDESTDMAAQAFYATAAGTTSPSVYGQQIFLTDRRIRTDPMGAQSEAGTHLGQTAAEYVDTALCGTAIFKAFTGGTAGTAGGTLTWQNIMRASAYLRTNKVPQPYFCVLHPVQWYYINFGTAGVPSLLQYNPQFANSVLAPFYQGGYSGIEFFVDANIVSGTAAIGGMFGRQGVYLDLRNPFKIEPQRDASRTGGGWELNATMEIAYGVYRPTFGCQIIGTSQ